ncbi:activator and specificity factor for anaphase promoting complex [Haematococcus lacustris]
MDPQYAPRSPHHSQLQYPTQHDRFIPSRAAASRLDFSILDREVVTADVSRVAPDREDINPAYNLLLRTELLGGAAPGPIPLDKAQQLEQLRMPCSPAKRMFSFKPMDASSPIGGAACSSPFATSPIGSENLGPISPISSQQRVPRRIARAPYKVLDAPSLQDDFYLNLVDWSSQNVLAVGLSSCVYLWSAHTGKVTKLCDMAPTDSVTSVAWSPKGTYISVGCSSGKVVVWDVAAVRVVKILEGHRARVGCIAWGSQLISSGARDRCILLQDVRAASPLVDKLVGHRNEVCGLKWSPDDQQLASGGNDNHLCVWQLGSGNPLHRFTDHQAAVKAIAWSPHKHGLLASGGGTADRCIRFWNTSNGAAISCMDTGSQVCNLAWSKNVNELVSTHGYSQNQIVVWKCPSMAKLATLTGHTMRVLYLAMSPDGQTIVTGAGDETLRFWSVFPGAKSHAPDTSMSSMARTTIR